MFVLQTVISLLFLPNFLFVHLPRGHWYVLPPFLLFVRPFQASDLVQCHCCLPSSCSSTFSSVFLSLSTSQLSVVFSSAPWRAQWCRTCSECQKAQNGGPGKAPLQPLPVIRMVAFDLVGLLPRLKRGYKYLFTYMCLGSKYLDAVPLRKRW